MLRFKKENHPQVHVDKNTIYDPTQTLIFQIHIDIKNKRLSRLNSLLLNLNHYRNK